MKRKRSSVCRLLNFLGIECNDHNEFPHLNAGKIVTTWRAYKHPNKVNSNAIGPDQRKFFDYIK